MIFQRGREGFETLKSCCLADFWNVTDCINLIAEPALESVRPPAKIFCGGLLLPSSERQLAVLELKCPQMDLKLFIASLKHIAEYLFQSWIRLSPHWSYQQICNPTEVTGTRLLQDARPSATRLVALA